MTNFVQYILFCRKKGRLNGDCTILSLYKRPSDSHPWQTQLSTVVLNDLTATWLPPAGGLIFEEPCSSLSKQWVALSLREPTVQRVTCKKGLSLACFRHLAVVPCCCFHHALCVFLPTAAPVTVTLDGLLRALTTGNTSAVLRCWPRGLTMSWKNRSVCHRGADKEMKSAAIILC